MERDKYIEVINEVILPIIDKTKEIDDYYLRELWFTIIDASERTLSILLFGEQPKSVTLSYNIELNGQDVLFWFKTTALCFISYIYYYYTPDDRKILNSKGYLKFENERCYGKLFDSYKILFNERPTYHNFSKYILGLKEDETKGYSIKGETEIALRLAAKDGIAIGQELLHTIWHENTEDSNIYNNSCMYGINRNNPIANKMSVIGLRIWQAHQQIIQPFLQKNPIGKTPILKRLISFMHGRAKR